jgi:hypothetical protein
MKSTFKLPVFRSRLFCLMAVSFALASSQFVRAANVTWTNAGPDLNWSDGANWSGGIPAGNAVFFNAAPFPGSTNAAGLVNNIVDASTTITGLTYNNYGTAFHTTLIAPSQTLTVNGTVTVGTNNQTTVVAITGTNCAFTVNNTAGSFNVEGSGATSQTATLTLADGTNTLNVGTLSLGETGGNNGRTANFNLGNSVNTINANNVNLGSGKASANVQFAGPSGSLTISNAAGTGRATLLLGNGTSGSGASKGQLLLAGHPATVFAGTVTLGKLGNTSGNQQGIVTIDHGLFDATSIQMGVIPSSGSLSTGTATGSSFTLGGDPSQTATLIVNSPSGPGGGSFILSGNANAAHTSSGTLTINQNGIAQIYCSITNAQVANNTGAIAVGSGGTLILQGVTNTIGTATVPINTVGFTGASLHLSVDGTQATANIYGTAVSASGTTITIDSVVNVIVPKTISLISYNPINGDPFSGFSLAPLPAGYTGSLVDNTVNNTVDLSISPNVTVPTLLWRGAVGSVLNGTWDKGGTANWLAGASPATYADPDIVHFDDTASNSTVNVSTMVGPGVLTVTNNSLNYTFNGLGAITGAVDLVKAGSGSLALTESGGDSFSFGVDVFGGTVILDGAGSSISGGAGVSSGATLQIGNNDANGNLPAGAVAVDGFLVFKRTDNLVVSTGISGSGSLIQQGAGKLTLSGVNQYSGNTAVLQGTLALTLGNAISISANVGVNSAGLDVSGANNTTTLNNLGLTNATVTLAANGSITPINVVSTLSLAGAGNSIAVTALPPIASYPTTLTLIQSGNAISGAFNVSVTLPAGFVGTAIPSADNSSVLLKLTSGPIGVRSSVVWVGTNGVSSTTNWSDGKNWQLPGVPVGPESVFFNGNGAVSATPFNAVGAGRDGITSPQNINNLVDSSFAVGTLTYTNLGGTFHNALLANGTSLTVNSNGSLTVGSGSTDFGAGATETVTIAGANGTLSVNNTNGTVYVGLGNSSGQATLDLSGLGNFNASVSRFFVGVGSSSAGIPVARASGIVYLALNNNIRAGITVGSTESSDTATNALAIDVGDDDGNAGMACALYLGQTNAIFGDAIGVGRQKPTGTMQFNPNLTGNNTRPAAFFRGANASRIATWSIGDQVVNSGNAEGATGTCDFSGGSVDALVNNMFVGRTANNSSGSGTATGTLALDAGIFNVTTLNCGLQPSNSVKVAIGTINVKTNTTLGTSGTIAVSGNFNLAVTGGGTGASTSTGTLNIDGGALSARTIICGTNGATSTVNLGASGNGGILTVTNTLGSAAAPLSALNLSGGTLQLGVNGTANVTNVIASAISASGTTTLNIVSVTHSTTGVAYPLISYAGTTDPFSTLSQGTLPAGAVGTITDDIAHSLIVITFTQVPATPATITDVSVSGITLSLTAAGANPNSQFVLQGATNLSLPVWKPILTNTFDGSGNLNLSTNVINPAVPQEFFRILHQ